MNQPAPRIGVNLLWLVPGEVGGSEESTVRSLLALPSDSAAVTLFARPDLARSHPELGERFDVITPPEWLVGSKGRRVAAENSWLAAVTRSLDLVHHAGGTVPFVTSTPTVLTVHDVQPLHRPENFSRAKRAWLRLVLPWSVRRARLILVPSEFTAEGCVEKLGSSRTKIRVVPHGYTPAPPGERPRLHGEVDQFLLLPGITYPHKRHRDAIEALAGLHRGGHRIHLVMTGRPDAEADSVGELVSQLGLGSHVHRLGRIDAGELAWLYTNARALLFPSEYEGFGYPVLEAMAHGCPVVAVRGGAVEEIVGPAGLLAEPRRPEELAQLVGQILDSDELADRLSRDGPERSREFSPDRNGLGLAAVYREALVATALTP